MLVGEYGCSVLILRVNELEWVVSEPFVDTYPLSYQGATSRQGLTPDDMPAFPLA